VAAFQEADGFRGVASWTYAYRIASPSAPEGVWESIEDGLDEGSGEKVLGVLRRSGLNGLLLLVTRWQDYGASSGLDMLGTSLYAQVVERCKDLINNLKQAVGMNDSEQRRGGVVELQKPPAGPKNFDFGFLPPLPEPRVPQKYGPNHFMVDLHMNRPQSLPNLFGGGDPRLWMANDKCLSQLSDSALLELRSMRQPEYRIERVLQAVQSLRGQRPAKQAGNAVARWGQCREVLRSATLRTELLLFDVGTVNEETARMALQLVDGLEVQDVRCVNEGAAGLLEWVLNVTRWRLDGPPSDDPSALSLAPLQARQADCGLGASMSAVQFPAPSKKRAGLAISRQQPARRSPVPMIASR